MQITIINDCCDENAKMRQISRASSLIKNSSANCFGVKSKFEASGFLVDAIDAFGGSEGVILVNFARREEKKPGWKNGSPFGFFWHRKTLVAASVDSSVLSLAKKMGLIEEFYAVDISDVLNVVKDGGIDEATKERIIKSQFRSFDFLPRLAAWVVKKKKIPTEKYDLEEIAVMPNCVWFIDNFGNIKTTLLKRDCDLSGKTVSLKIEDKVHKFSFFERLKDLPNQEIGLTVGSSGIGNERFLEIMFRGGNAAKELGIKEGSLIEVIKY